MPEANLWVRALRSRVASDAVPQTHAQRSTILMSTPCSEAEWSQMRVSPAAPTAQLSAAQYATRLITCSNLPLALMQSDIHRICILCNRYCPVHAHMHACICVCCVRCVIAHEPSLCSELPCSRISKFSACRPSTYTCM